MSPLLTPQILEQIEILHIGGASKSDIKSYIKKATGLGKTQTNFAYHDSRKYLFDKAKAKPTNMEKTEPVVTKPKFDKKNGIIDYTGNHIKTLEQLLTACQVDLDAWKVKSHEVNKWDTTLKDTDGEPRISQNFQVKARLERTPEEKIIKEFFLNFTPKPIPPLKVGNLADKTSDKVFVSALSDLHFGSASREQYMYAGKDWTTQDTADAVDRYSLEIIKEAQTRNYKFKKCVVLCIGDFIHSLLGKTARGTELKYDCIKEEQFDYAFNALLIFFERMIQFFGEVEVHDVGGNHAYELDMALLRGLGAAFRNEKRIKFHHHSTRPAAFKVDSTLFLMDHGQDSYERSHVPKAGKPRESFIQSLYLQKPELLDGIKTKLFVQGDKHHFENIEYNDFEFIMFSTSLGSDEHASINNWRNRPRQTCLVLDKDGLKEVIHFYTHSE